MSTLAMHRAMLADLAQMDGKAELIGGRIVAIMPTSYLPGIVSSKIHQSLKLRANQIWRGVATLDRVRYKIAVIASGRESFCTDAAYHDGPLPTNRIRCIDGPPTFAVEVRCKNDLELASERAKAAKRLDYFAASTLVVWDLDSNAELIHAYHPDTPDQPITYGKGQSVIAKPVVSGWRIAIAKVFA